MIRGGCFVSAGGPDAICDSRSPGLLCSARCLCCAPLVRCECRWSNRCWRWAATGGVLGSSDVPCWSLALVSTRGASFSAPLCRSSPGAFCPNPDALAGSKAMSYSEEYTELLSPWLRLRKLTSTSEIFELYSPKRNNLLWEVLGKS